MRKDIKELFGTDVSLKNGESVRTLIKGIVIDGTYPVVPVRPRKMLLADLNIYINTSDSVDELLKGRRLFYILTKLTTLTQQINHTDATTGLSARWYTCTDISRDGTLDIVYKFVMKGGKVDTINVLLIPDAGVDTSKILDLWVDTFSY